MRRKVLYGTIMAALVVLLALFTAAGVAEEERTDASGQWKYVLDDGGATITGYVEEPEGDLVIPSELDGYPVKGIGERAFSECYGLTGVTVPGSVTNIGKFAFSDCANVTSVIISEGVPSIGDGMFAWCKRLTSVTIPDSCSSIGELAFSGCQSLTDITLPDNVTSIGDLAFSACNKLTSITIPVSVTKIGRNPFALSTLVGVNVSSNHPIYELIDGVLYDKQQNMLVYCPSTREGAYTIPEGVLVIGDHGFCGCKGLTVVTIPDSVTSIGDYAFFGCKSLTGMVIPDGVTRIGELSFSSCSALTDLSIPATVTCIGEVAFDYGITLEVVKGSYAAEYAKEHNMLYVFVAE